MKNNKEQMFFIFLMILFVVVVLSVGGYYAFNSQPQFTITEKVCEENEINDFSIIQLFPDSPIPKPEDITILNYSILGFNKIGDEISIQGLVNKIKESSSFYDLKNKLNFSFNEKLVFLDNDGTFINENLNYKVDIKVNYIDYNIPAISCTDEPRDEIKVVEYQNERDSDGIVTITLIEKGYILFASSLSEKWLNEHAICSSICKENKNCYNKITQIPDFNIEEFPNCEKWYLNNYTITKGGR